MPKIKKCLKCLKLRYSVDFIKKDRTLHFLNLNPLAFHLPTFRPSHLHTFPPSDLLTFIPSYLPTFIPSYLQSFRIPISLSS